MSIKTVTSRDGTKIWAESRGDTSKQALVWVHGVAAGAVYFERPFSDPQYLENFYMVRITCITRYASVLIPTFCFAKIRYDVRGYGLSGQPPNIKSYASERLAEDWEAVTKAFGVKDPIIVAWYVFVYRSNITWRYLSSINRSLGGLIVTDILSSFGAKALKAIIYLCPVVNKWPGQEVRTF